MENNPVLHGDNFNETDANIINTYFGEIQWERAENYANYLSLIGMDCEFNKYVGVGQLFTLEMVESMFEFFENN